MLQNPLTGIMPSKNYHRSSPWPPVNSFIPKSSCSYPIFYMIPMPTTVKKENFEAVPWETGNENSRAHVLYASLARFSLPPMAETCVLVEKRSSSSQTK